MQYSSNYDGIPGTTVLFTATADSAYTLAQMGVDLVNADGLGASMVLISIETNSARFAFVADASATLGHLRYADESFQISGGKALSELTVRNAVNGSNFTAQITPFFGR